MRNDEGNGEGTGDGTTFHSSALASSFLLNIPFPVSIPYSRNFFEIGGIAWSKKGILELPCFHSIRANQNKRSRSTWPAT